MCANCYNVGFPKNIYKGSMFTEFVLLVLGIIPGIIYSLWRIASRYKGCPKCKGNTMIPVNTPRGQKLLNEASCLDRSLDDNLDK